MFITNIINVIDIEQRPKGQHERNGHLRNAQTGQYAQNTEHDSNGHWERNGH